MFQGLDIDVINTLISLAIGVITLGGLLGGLWFSFRKRIKGYVDRTKDVLAAAEQLPVLVAANAAFKDELSAVSGMAKRVQEAVLPNGGGSIPDELKRMSTQHAAFGEQISVIGKKVDSIANTQRANQNANPRVATFETDDKGRCTYANRTYLRWTGLSLAEVLGWGWLNAIHPDYQARVRGHWDSAVADSRRFQERYKMVHVDGSAFEVDGTAEPIPENVTPAERWVGMLVKVEVP